MFLKPTTRVLRDLDDLAQGAKCMIAIDESGNKVETSVTADGFATSSLVEHGPEAEEKLRSAGRTILAYRMQTMTVAQGTLAKMEDILKLEGVSLPPEPHKHIYNVSKSATSVQLKDKLVGLVTSAIEEQSRIDQGKQMDMAPFPLYKSANLAEEWSQLESATIFSVLCTFGICGLYTGRFDFGFSSKAFVETLQRDKELWERIGIIGKHRLGLSEGLVSSFAFFNRRLTMSTTTASAAQRRNKQVMELIGAPMFLTCALVIDACKMFLEGAVFVLITYTVLQTNYDARLLSMIQAAQRLEEFDGNRYGQEDVDQLEDDRPAEGASQPPPPPLSICQVSAKFIREMVDTLQKWKLAYSIYRKPRFPSTTASESGRSPETPKSTLQDGVVAASPTTRQEPTHGNQAQEVEAAIHSHEPRTGYEHNYLLATPINPVIATGRSTVVASTEGLGASGSGPNAILHGFTTGWAAYMHPVATGGAPPPTGTGHPQGHFVLPTQFWPEEADGARMYGSAEHLLGGAAFMEPNLFANDNGGMNEIPLFNAFFDSFLPH
ncbi:hypothetical protein B0O80DRAFT_466379 [Mortierella sp. GBAus27b]|nr:hypothetical protein B0O80DRAFT_466379 [Mortierella sp. GBAus27b]